MTSSVENSEKSKLDEQWITGKARPSSFSGEWKLMSLDNLAIFLKGFGLPKSALDPSKEHPCIHYGELFTIYGVRISRVVSRTNALSASVLAQPNDVLMPTSDVTPTGLATASVIEDSGVAIGGDVLIIRPNSDLLLGVFLANAIRFHRKQILSLVTGSTVYHIYASEMKKFVFNLPPVQEQQSIVEILLDSDLLLESLDKLITKKRAIKQGAMQLLLTGKTRLPGFKDAWQQKKISELGSLHKGRGIRKNEVLTHGIACVRYGEIYTRFESSVRECFSFISKEVAKTSVPLVFGDIIFAVSGETSTDIGKCTTFLGNFEAYIGSDTVVLRPEGHDPTYLGYSLNYGTVSIQKAALGQGDAVVHLSAYNLASIEFRLPPITEQIAIAKVLTEMDAEIDALVARREKTALIKIGMMQDLLTGKVRL